MKKSVLIVLLSLVGSMAYSQYFYIAKKGVEAAFDPFTSTGAATLLDKPSNDVLSPTQTIPFAWSYYGNPVTTYKVSDNGYITFDANATTSIGANTTLPDAGGPNDAIYAFWDDLELKTFTPNANAIIAVKSWTYGSAPKRIHVIQWMGASPAGQASASNIVYATVRLYEGGDFDVVNSYGFGTFSGTIGCENADGSMGTMVAGSPTRNFGGGNGSYDPATSDVFEFHFGTQSMYDIAMLSSTTPEVVSVTAGATISGVLANWGSAAINSFTLNYSVDGGNTVSQKITSLNIAPSGGTYNFTHPTKATLTTPGTNYAIKVWATAINDNADENPANDELNFSIFGNNGISGTKHVLVEEGTGAWCGYCPDGHLRMRDIIDQNPNTVVAVMHHNSDGMTNTNSNTINSTYQTGYPYGMIDRTLFSGQPTVGQNRGLWANRVATQLNDIAPLEISITSKTFNPTTRKIDFTVEVKSVDHIQGDIRINAYVVENDIIGADNSNFSQRNYYSKNGAAAGGSGHALYNETDPIVGYSHQHVVRSIPSGAWGTQGVIPALVAPNATYTQTYSYTLPAETSVTLPGSTSPVRGMNKADHINLVAFVSYYNTDPTKRQVVNATEVGLFGGYNSVTEVTKNTVSTNVYPNPASGVTTVSFTLDNAASASVEVYDLMGSKVLTAKEGQFTSGEHFVAFNAENLKNGLYLVQVKVDNQVAGVSKFLVNK